MRTSWFILLLILVFSLSNIVEASSNSDDGEEEYFVCANNKNGYNTIPISSVISQDYKDRQVGGYLVYESAADCVRKFCCHPVTIVSFVASGVFSTIGLIVYFSNS